MDELADFRHRTDISTDQSRPARPRSGPGATGPAPEVNACSLAYAARDAVREVLPAGWQHLPDGRDTANLLAGTIANHYTVWQSVQVERRAPRQAGDALIESGDEGG